ncbi:hypothetical protein M9H77_06496 [Catharanthus roseus]|uniref:Uncharacterized protein n=1 Tax=Catharanthus roseus TaxID=4058 RepID=A0ACC0BSC0_CATRO|nr:hypothetical protein M9H77_06496 [Catharanthus roseus]
MEFWSPFGAAAAILLESIKLLPKNGKLFTSILVLPVILFSSIFFLIFNFSYKSLLRDMLVKESFWPISSPTSAEFSTLLAYLRPNFPKLLFVDLSFILGYFIISFFSKTGAILLSALSYSGKTIYYKDFLLLILQSWKRPFITGFHTTLLVIGYIYFVLSMASPLLISSTMTNLSLAILMGIFAYFFYLYLSVSWILAIVISMIEEDCFGIEALGKAGKIVKGKRHHGFIINIIFAVLSAILFQGFRIMRGYKWLWLENEKVFGLVLVSLSWVFNMFEVVGFTVLYFQCKKKNGEEIEIQIHGDNQYNKLPNTTTLVTDI